MTRRRLLLALGLLVLVAFRAFLVHEAFLGPRTLLLPRLSDRLAALALNVGVPGLCLAAAAFLAVLRPRAFRGGAAQGDDATLLVARAL